VVKSNTTTVEINFCAEKVRLTVAVEILDAVSIGVIGCFELGKDLL
jgi:hypothetical protein